MGKMQFSDVQLHEKGHGRVIMELAKAYHPRYAIREFVTNALDARIPETQENILVSINQPKKSLIVFDNGTGMPYDKLISLPKSVGYSNKAEHVDSRGEKGLGLLSFGSLGSRMHILSRPHEGNQDFYGHLLYEINNGKLRHGHEKLSSQDLEAVRDRFYGNFPSGTRVVIEGIPQGIMDKFLTNTHPSNNLKQWLRQVYSPAIRNGDVNIHFGKYDKRSGSLKSETLDEIDYEDGREFAELFMDKTLSIPIKGQDEPGELEVLLYIDPEGAYDKVPVYSKDVQVYQSLAELDEFNRSPVWASGKVLGFVNDRFNKLVLGRDGIQRGSNAYKAWYEALSQVEEELKPIVEQHKKSVRKLQETKTIRQVMSAMHDAVRNLEREGMPFQNIETGLYQEDSQGEMEKVKGQSPREPGPGGRGSGGKKGGRGPGTYVKDEEGTRRRVSPKKGLPASFIQPIDFPLHEGHLRSRLEERIGGDHVIYVNSAHGDYTARSDSKDTSVFQRYLIELVSKEFSMLDALNEDKKGALRGEPLELLEEALLREEAIKFQAMNALKIR